MNKNRNIFIGVIVVIIIVIIGAVVVMMKGGSTKTSTGDKKVIIGSKNFTESLILGEMYSIALEDAGYKVERKLNLGGTLVAHEALKKGDIDMYPEYTGTGLLDILKQPKKSDAKEVYDYVSAEYKKNWNLIWLNATSANDSQGLAVTKKISDQYKITTISQLAAAAPNLKFASVPEFNDRDDGLKGLKAAYGGFNFKDNQLYDYGIKYKVILGGKADATVAFTTDGDLTNKDLVLLKDDKNFWPPYFVCPVVKGEFLSKNPDAKDIINKVSKALTQDKVIALNAQVDIDKKEFKVVAKDFLTKEGLIKKQ